MILNSKLTYAKAQEADAISLGVIPGSTRAVQQVESDLDKLKLRACAQVPERGTNPL
jgi:hypothetical protein